MKKGAAGQSAPVAPSGSVQSATTAVPTEVEIPSEEPSVAPEGDGGEVAMPSL